ncbi:MAG: hypothetical protein COW18_08960 [Zetaproteobacteria bacterium CG12_big_fil_rev_8_21_14_0_65_54_13]|nr:MAG: hypothetical protein COW18_08960 [Zetaproteobacteria bacterium CG12_big_fil_rev_8_21_14_0_65_54_13]PIX53895.1 MAG: hypothetical protein COZ50_10700 [Zetaproteobacteria bacterium CG_4_10_14_3_um_filter_54_28]PJA30064.1 MAG: hypothetical protein CO188_04660 [Zetaproteobacteria bacterium CG_4_9_14_3_um_filter_54_145]
MDISLTPQELSLLLQLACIGEWVKHGHLEGNERADAAVVAHKHVLRKLQSIAHNAGMSALVEYDDKRDEYFETKEFEADYLQCIDAYVEESFWEELADRLAARDLVGEFGEEGFAALARFERIGKITELSEWYLNEWSTHGIRRLKVDAGHGGSELEKLN